MYRTMGIMRRGLTQALSAAGVVKAMVDQPTDSGPVVQPSLQTICK